MKLKRLLVLLIILPAFSLTGCWSSHEVNTLAIAIGIGIDRTKNGYLVTMQILNSKAIASKKGTEESPVIVFAEEGKDFNEIMRRVTTKTPRRIVNSHLRMVVFGEAVAKDGIKDILDYFARGHEFRTDFFFVVAKGTTANKILSILTPFETVPGIKMYESLKTSEDLWAPTKSIRIIELINSILADGNNPVLTGVDISNEITDSNMPTTSTDALKESQIRSRTNYFGLGVFNKDKLVGWLNENESKGYNYITGNIKSTVGYAEYGKNIKITYEVTSETSKMKASLVDGKPIMNVEIKLITNISAVEGEFDVSKKENEKVLSELASQKTKLMCEKTVAKAQNELRTDIFGFGEAIHRAYPKVWRTMKDNWNNEFTNLPVIITVDVKINQLGQITTPLFIKEKK